MAEQDGNSRNSSMMHLFLNCLAASAGAGLTYVRNVVPHLASRTDLRATILLTPALREEFGNFPNISFVEIEAAPSAAKRFYQEQSLAGIIRRRRADVLISTGNFALRNSPIPQILLSGNSLYTSEDFSRDVRSRGDYGLWLDTRIKGFFARQSLRWADCTIAPSSAFAEELRRWSGGATRITAIHHGFDRAIFLHDQAPLPEEIQTKLESSKDALRLLFVSHYNYYRNFETLLRAIPLLREHLSGQKIRLYLTCKFRSEENPGAYRAEATEALVQDLGISEEVVELGSVPYRSLYKVYKACNLYVTAAYAETFAHPVVEAMASSLPVIASDIAAHREICGRAAMYFSRFSAEELALRIVQVATSDSLRRQLTECGSARSQDFSWEKHVSGIVDLARKLVNIPATDKSLLGMAV
jgi:glycosyltransferase involved in cell wall biosynthesis